MRILYTYKYHVVQFGSIIVKFIRFSVGSSQILTLKNKSHTTNLSRVTMDKSASVKVSEICWWGSNQLAFQSSPNFFENVTFH